MKLHQIFRQIIKKSFVRGNVFSFFTLQKNNKLVDENTYYTILYLLIYFIIFAKKGFFHISIRRQYITTIFYTEKSSQSFFTIETRCKRKHCVHIFFLKKSNFYYKWCMVHNTHKGLLSTLLVRYVSVIILNSK